MIVELQCLPSPAGVDGEPYRHIDAAIEVIRASGLAYEVSALGTTFEGEPDTCWRVLRAAHEACLTAGAERLVSVVKLAEAAGGGPGMGDLTHKFRAGP